MIYGKFAETALVDQLGGATLKAMLVTSAYAQDHTHEFRSSVTAVEASGPGYTAGGVTLTGVTITLDTVQGRVVVMCDEIAFGAIDLVDCAGIVFYISTGSAATDPLIGSDTWASEDTGALPFSYLPNPDDGFVVAIT